MLALRLFNVYGPLQPVDHAYAAVVPAFVSAAVAGRALQVHGDGEETRDFIPVASVTEVLTAALRRGTTCEGPVNLAVGSRRSVNEVVDDVVPMAFRDGLAATVEWFRTGAVR